MSTDSTPDAGPRAAAAAAGAQGGCEIELRSQRIVLHPARAIVWPARRTVIVADTHFGKDDLFRRSGIALPRGPAISDLQRLAQVIARSGSERVVVLGDFVHAATQGGDSFLQAFAVWRRAHSQLAFEVIAGNHDRREVRRKWGDLVRWHDGPVVDDPFVLAHEPAADGRGYVLAGHLHPAVRLPGLGGAGRVPVFWVRPDSLVLPSFGSFTGGVSVRPEHGDRIYAAAPERVVKLNV